MSLNLKLLELQKAVVGLNKDKAGNSYQYVSGDKILSIVRPTMDKLGLLLIPEVVDSKYSRQDYNLINNKGEVKPKTEIFCSLKLKFTWVDAESGETLVCYWASSGQNNFDKGLGSALTYGERYFLLKFFHIQTDKDDVDAPKSPEEEMNDMNWEKYFDSLTTEEALDAAWNQYGDGLKNNKKVIIAFNKRKQEIRNEAKSKQ